ncbi:IclR family transcriptional regulator [Streptomyces sp. NA02950]|uniref:IclR family transcriptional regulator n=1 Tax=Streptomyces sp. NA02950 TaxID=2742137 RepID=UPI00159009CC|nr:IclR family transcriptional regulator [Streptomyces sp. NA02950]QKV96219.1 IclR family transcriptional regulator [Streptomyces sp. NA02950]
MHDNETYAVDTGDLLGSVRRALAVLEAVAAGGDGITAKAVARRAGVTLPTTYRLLNTLVHDGYLVRLNHCRGYGLGYKLTGLHRRLCQQLEVTPGVSRALHRIHQECGAAAYYTVFRDEEIVVAEVVDSPEARRAEPLDIGFHQAPHATAFGKVMLSFLPAPGRRDHVREQGLARLTPSTITAPDVLEEHLGTVRTSGVAFEVGEFLPELSCVAAPVFHASGRVVGAVATSVPVDTFTSRRRQLEESVRFGADHVSGLLARGAGPAW